jgi:transcriptional regulator with XRE-family HTH domain
VSHLYRLLGRQLAHFRLKAGLTQEELAEKTDYSVDFIGLVERGINAPTVARLQDIAGNCSIRVKAKEISRRANRHVGLQRIQRAERRLSGGGALTLETFSVGDLCRCWRTIYWTGACGV